MKQSGKKKSNLRTIRSVADIMPQSTTDAEGLISNGLVDKQPQLMEQAAVAQQMFLHVDDAWAQRYFDPNDLHFLEREVFG